MPTEWPEKEPVPPDAESRRWVMINHRLGALGIVTNNASITGQAVAPELSPYQWERLLDMAAR